MDLRAAAVNVQKAAMGMRSAAVNVIMEKEVAVVRRLEEADHQN